MYDALHTGITPYTLVIASMIVQSYQVPVGALDSLAGMPLVVTGV